MLDCTWTTNFEGLIIYYTFCLKISLRKLFAKIQESIPGYKSILPLNSKLGE